MAASQTSGNIGGWNLKLAMTADKESAASAFAQLGEKVEAERKRQESSWARGMQQISLDTANQRLKDAEFEKEFNHLLQLEAKEKAFNEWYAAELAKEAAQKQADHEWLMSALADEQEQRDRAFAEAQQHVAELDAAYQASEKKRLAEVAERRAAEEEYLRYRMGVASRADNPYGTARVGWDAKRESESLEKRRDAAAKAERTIATVREQEQKASENRWIARQLDNYHAALVEQTRFAKNASRIADDAKTEIATITTSGGGRNSWMNRMSEAERRNMEANRIASISRGGNVLQEFGRGVEDFFVSASMGKNTTEAIALGMRGAANNAAQLASNFGPVAGAATAIGASLAVVIVPQVLRWLDGSKELEKSQEKIRDAMSEQENSARKTFEFFSKMDSASGARSEVERQRTELAALKDQQRILEERKFKNFETAIAAGMDPNKLFEETKDKLAKNAAAQLKAQNDLAIAETVLDKKVREEKAKAFKKDQEELALWSFTEKQKQADEERQAKVKALDEEYKFMKEAEERNLEAQIDSRTESIDKLQERIQKSGNAAGPSAALISGTQAAESIISRALTGSRSVEDTMKAQLKVEQDQLKELRRIQTRKTATI